MFKIGDFSKLSQVSIKALRLYDQMGLLKPAQVDHFTGYRYYSANQLSRLNRILAFKDLGFSLEQIAQLLDRQVPPAQIRELLRCKQVELQQHIETETARLARVEVRLRQIEQESKMTDYEVILKKIEPLMVVSIRETLPSYQHIGHLFDELASYLRQHSIDTGDYCTAIWHDSDFKETDVDGEAVLSVPQTVKGSNLKHEALEDRTEIYDLPKVDPLTCLGLLETNRIKLYELPGYDTVACLVHHGSYKRLSEAYGHLLNWIETNGYRIIGANREFYIHGGHEQDNESYVTELQFPVVKD